MVEEKVMIETPEALDIHKCFTGVKSILLSADMHENVCMYAEISHLPFHH